MSTLAQGRHPLDLKGGSLRWAVGLFCAIVGAFMLVAPHQFRIQAFWSVPAVRTAWAVAALAAGVALLSVASLRTGRRQRLLAHGLAGAVMLSVGGGILLNGSGIGAVPYLVLGAGLLSHSALRGRPLASPAGDLLALLTGLSSALSGAGLLLVPRFVRTPFPTGTSPPEWQLLLASAAMLASGAWLAWVQLRPPSPRLRQAAHLAGGLAFAGFGLQRTLALPAWTILFLYCGLGLGIALLPWTERWLAGFDASALRTRMALALAVATCVSLVIAVAVSTAQEERLATSQAQGTLEIEARSIAQDVRDYLELDAARAATVAGLASELPLTPDLQGQLLAQSLPLYHRLHGLMLSGLDGKLIAGQGGATLTAARRAATAAAAVSSAASPISLAADPATGRHLLLVAARVNGRDGRPRAVLIMAFDAAVLDEHIARQGSIVSLGDGIGHLIARASNLQGLRTAPGMSGGMAGAGGTAGVPAGLQPASQLPPGWDRRTAGGVLVRFAIPDRLAAAAPLLGLNWSVAIERPRLAALAGVDRGRNFAFALLLLVLPLAIAGGILVARLITRPLGGLADAAERLAMNQPWTPLERSTIGEVERLSASFREMRDRLAKRTAESERLAAELRARAEALAETDRRKDEFLAMLAHELRNPLGAVSSAGYILAQTPGIGPPANRAVAVIQRQTQHLARLVDDLLDVSRITRGKVELRRVPIDLSEVVRDAIETTRPILEARHHRLELALPAEPLHLLADPTRLEQVLANLIRNAAKFSEPGGLVAVEAAARGGWAVVRVRDTGKGISSELLPRVFDLFIQGEQGLDRSTGGLGIGLTLVRNLVEMHGGHVQAESAGEGRGSEFIVWLPLVWGEAPRPAPPATATPATTAAPATPAIIEPEASPAPSAATAAEADALAN